MMGYLPQQLPQSYIASKGLGDAGYSPPPLVQANAASNSQSSGGGILSIVGSLFGSAMNSSTQSSLEFNAATNAIQAQALADDRSRRWATFGAFAVGIAGLAGVVYLLKRK